MNQKRTNFFPHLLLWGIVWIFYALIFSYNSDNIPYILSLSIFLLVLTMLISYIVLYFLIPKFLTPKKYLLFSVYAVITALFTMGCLIFFLLFSLAYFPSLEYENLPPMSRNFIWLQILIFLVVALISYGSLWQKNSLSALKNSELQKQLLDLKFHAKEQELAYLKNQIQPHFLFNTLNTIYGLALQKREETPEVILKLSNLLDYILYQVHKPRVPLLDEISNLEKYLALEKIRFKDTLLVNFTKELTSEQVLVPPLLLLPFVENAFKHGSLVEGYLKIEMLISSNDNYLHFNIKNTSNKLQKGKGIGLTNIQERLKILFPSAHELKINASKEWFEVDLKIDSI